MADTEVTVTWLDGMQETYRCDKITVREGVLWLTQNTYPAKADSHCRIPLYNVRIWTEPS